MPTAHPRRARRSPRACRTGGRASRTNGTKPSSSTRALAGSLSIRSQGFDPSCSRAACAVQRAMQRVVPRQVGRAALQRGRPERRAVEVKENRGRGVGRMDRDVDVGQTMLAEKCGHLRRLRVRRLRLEIPDGDRRVQRDDEGHGESDDGGAPPLRFQLRNDPEREHRQHENQPRVPRAAEPDVGEERGEDGDRGPEKHGDRRPAPRGDGDEDEDPEREDDHPGVVRGRKERVRDRPARVGRVARPGDVAIRRVRGRPDLPRREQTRDDQQRERGELAPRAIRAADDVDEEASGTATRNGFCARSRHPHAAQKSRSTISEYGRAIAAYSRSA